MSKYFKRVDLFAVNLTKLVINNRLMVLLLAIIIAVAAGSGGRLLGFSTDYRAFFSDANPELIAFEKLYF